MTDPMLIGDGSEPHPVADAFIAELAAMATPKVIEFGTKKWDENLTTHHAAWVPHAQSYLMADIEAGAHVDAVVDLHQAERDLDKFLGHRSVGHFDAVIAISTWEHVRFPWVAASQVRQILRPGGVGYISTHHSFPRHGYPHDATRWDTYGLENLFEWAGLETVATGTAYPCKIAPPPNVTRWNEAAPAWLEIEIMVRKPAP